MASNGGVLVVRTDQEVVMEQVVNSCARAAHPWRQLSLTGAYPMQCPIVCQYGQRLPAWCCSLNRVDLSWIECLKNSIGVGYNACWDLIRAMLPAPADKGWDVTDPDLAEHVSVVLETPSERLRASLRLDRPVYTQVWELPPCS